MDHNSRDRHDSGGEGMRKKTDTDNPRKWHVQKQGLGALGCLPEKL